MNKMKTPALALLMCICLLPIIQGCKKGEDDPFFTFRTRKNRVEGNWKLTTCNASFSIFRHRSGSPDQLTIGDSSIILSNNKLESAWVMSSTISGPYGGPYETKTDRQYTGIITYNLLLTKEGTFTATLEIKNFDIVTSGSNSYYPDPTITGVASTVGKTETKGWWRFNSGPGGDYKKKECIILDFLEETSSRTQGDGKNSVTTNTKKTFHSGERQEMWAIRELRHRTMVIDIETDLVTNYHKTYETSYGVSTEVVDETIKGLLTATFTQ